MNINLESCKHACVQTEIQIVLLKETKRLVKKVEDVGISNKLIYSFGAL